MLHSNTPPFRFKRFTVCQQQSAMKVGFDGVLLGAWANVTGCRQILDIGSGTGLISLMLAQRTELDEAVAIHGVEVDVGAHHESVSNVQQSPWADRIVCHRAKIQDYARACSLQFDLVISNPPFFAPDPKGTQANTLTPRTVARRAASLDLAELFEIASRLVRRGGRLSLILPIDRHDDCLRFALQNDFRGIRRTIVKPNSNAAAKRVLMEFQFLAYQSISFVMDDVITIETGQRHVYTDEFTELTRQFYLKM